MVEKANTLIIIEKNQLQSYLLDDKLSWTIGRPSGKNQPDIKLYTPTVSREHGEFKNMDGVWFYLDKHGVNGTVYNHKYLEKGTKGRIKPILLKEGDVFVFGGSKEEVINEKTVWALYTRRHFQEPWRCVDTKGFQQISFLSGHQETSFLSPNKGLVIDKEEGIAIYMGEITFLQGKIQVVGLEEA